MEKVKIMSVAPYEGLRDLLLQEAKNRSDIKLNVFLGDLAKGAEHVLSMQNDGYSVIISRGGTAEMIERMASAIPLVEIGVSGFDVLRAIKLARNFSGHFAIVGFASITNSARTLCDLLQYEIEIITITIGTEAEVDECLSGLKERGFTLIVGDTVVVNRAKTLGLGAILIMSGPESVRLAIDQAVKLSHQISRSNSNEVLYRNILDDIFEYVAVFNVSGDEVFRNFSNKRNADMDTRSLKKYIADVAEKGHVVISVKQKNILWSIKASKHTVDGNDYFIFCINPIHERQDSNIFRFLNYDEVSPNQIEAYYGDQDISLNPSLKAGICGEYPSPLLIVGEYGTCKETIAKLAHINSHYRDCPMVIVDSWLIDEKKWISAIEGRNSLNS
ncbi:MAG: PrpR N-terminal domain-containing protein, partial [Synergistaceae bacterium]|nr:PrpR N-terminal domain-containing protein [Synergistaceae bacterium]